MDETLARAAVDLCGRPFLYFDGQLSDTPILASPDGNKSEPFYFQTAAIEDFWQGFTSAVNCALHLEILRGRSDHHKIEAMFKAAGRSLRAACEIDDRARDIIPSTKGALGTPNVLV
jgi:imidazoleglycerol-phosphate dehydratase